MVPDPPRMMMGGVAARAERTPPVTSGLAAGTTEMGITTALRSPSKGADVVAVEDAAVVDTKAAVEEAVGTTTRLTITTTTVIKDKAAAASTTTAPRTTTIMGPHRAPPKVATTHRIKGTLKAPLKVRAEEEFHSTLG